MFHGRGIWISIGLLPYRHPIVSVGELTFCALYLLILLIVNPISVGRPIPTKQNPNPTKADLEEIQKLYIEELERIWNQWKDAYAANRTKELTIVD